MKLEDVTLTIAIPTIGRPSLYSTLHSVLTGGIGKGDQVFVVGDGKQPEAERIVRNFTDRMPVAYWEMPANRKSPGHPARNFVLKRTATSHFMTIDDDDVYVPGSLSKVKLDAAKNDGKILIYKMRGVLRGQPYEELWRVPQVSIGNVGTPMIVVPNDQAKLGTWGDCYEGDFDFFESTARNYGHENIVWLEDVIAEIY